MHLIPIINAHHRAISFDRFMGMFNSIPQQQDHRFKPERWYVLSQCGQHIYSVVIYFVTLINVSSTMRSVFDNGSISRFVTCRRRSAWHYSQLTDAIAASENQLELLRKR